MSRPEVSLPYDVSTLVTQPSNRQIICLACSLINALKLSGATVSERDTELLISNVELSGQPLKTQQIHEFARKYSREVEFVPLPDEVTDVTEFVDAFTKALSKGPDLMSISTFLSKRDSIVPSLHEDQLSEEHRGKPVVHSVTSIIKDNTVFIIDPYNSGDPELFDVTNQDEKVRLAAWLFSSYFQKYHQFTEAHKDKKETLIEEAVTRLSDSQFIESEDNLRFCKIEARIRVCHV